MRLGFVGGWMIRKMSKLVLHSKAKYENRMCGFLTEVKPNGQLI